MQAAYKRILLKLSGGVFSGNKEMGMDFDKIKEIAAEIKRVKDLGVEVAIVIGGGNLWRFRDFKDTGVDRVISDNMGMLATVMNGAVLKSVLKNLSVEAEVFAPFFVPQIAEVFVRDKADSCFKEGKIVICAGGTGNPYFTTDTAAALRALELNCDILLKATDVDGVYDSDPVENPQAKKFERITFSEVIERDLKVMDATAFSLCREGNMSIKVFNLNQKDNIEKVVKGVNLGTTIVV